PPGRAPPTPTLGGPGRGGTRAPFAPQLLPLPRPLGQAEGPHDSMKERAYLREVQYRDGTNLKTRAALHERFSVNPVGLQSWVVAQVDPPARARILEVGCGPGNLWVANLTRRPEGWQIVLSDFSPGMVQAACRRLSGRRFAFEVAEAEAVPHRAGTLDAVIA